MRIPVRIELRSPSQQVSFTIEEQFFDVPRVGDTILLNLGDYYTFDVVRRMHYPGDKPNLLTLTDAKLLDDTAALLALFQKHYELFDISGDDENGQTLYEIVKYILGLDSSATSFVSITKEEEWTPASSKLLAEIVRAAMITSMFPDGGTQKQLEAAITSTNSTIQLLHEFIIDDKASRSSGMVDIAAVLTQFDDEVNGAQPWDVDTRAVIGTLQAVLEKANIPFNYVELAARNVQEKL